MIALFCDLDNTILYSHRRMLSTTKRVAEMLNGKEQSYITEKTFSFLTTCKSVSFIPVTSRTLQQYDRVRSVLEGFNCRYALILNGAILIEDGRIDRSWLAESKEAIIESRAEMNRASKLLETHSNSKLRYSDDFLSYVSAADPEGVANMVRQSIDPALIRIYSDNRKVYCTPAMMSKGAGVERLIKKLCPNLTVGAGDSINDLSMLEIVDIPILPQIISSYISSPRKIEIPKNSILSDAICDEIEHLMIDYIETLCVQRGTGTG